MSILNEMVEMLDGREVTSNIARKNLKYATDNGVVIVFGSSSDSVKFYGAINDEADTRCSALVYFDRSGEIRSECSDAWCPYFDTIRGNASWINAIWDTEGYRWVYETDIPHKTFDVLENGSKYCRGIVFMIDDVKEVS